MIVIYLKGGIGNQLFQYALYTSLQSQGKQVRLDYTTISDEMTRIHRGTIFDTFLLDRDYHPDTISEIAQKLQRRVFNRVFRKLTCYYVEKEDGEYDPDVLALKHGYLDGYWQSPKYFEGCEAELRQRLQFKHTLSTESRQMLGRITQAQCPVSVHVRLGDYTTDENSALFGNICTKEYYSKAIAHITQRHPNASFFVFSNEPRKAAEVIDIPNAVIVDINDESAASADMYLMSQCHHNILANSSFSWWSAWLNQNPQKQVIAPKTWINGKNTPDVCPESWIRL